MGLDFDLEEGNIKGVKEDKKRGSGGKVAAAAVIIVILAAIGLFFISNRSVLYGILPGFGSSFTPITTLGSDSNADAGSTAGDSAATGQDSGLGAEQNASEVSNAKDEAGKLQEQPTIAFSAQLVSSDYSMQASNTDIEIEGEVEGKTEGGSFSYMNGTYGLKNFSGTISTSKGFVELNGKADTFEIPLGKTSLKGEISLTQKSGILSMQDVYLTSFSQNVTGSVTTSSSTMSASGKFSLKGFRGKIVLKRDNSVLFDGKTSRLGVATPSGNMDLS